MQKKHIGNRGYQSKSFGLSLSESFLQAEISGYLTVKAHGGDVSKSIGSKFRSLESRKRSDP